MCLKLSISFIVKPLIGSLRQHINDSLDSLYHLSMFKMLLASERLRSNQINENPKSARDTKVTILKESEILNVTIQ